MMSFGIPTGPLIHLKSQRGRGGYIRDIHFKNITMLGETNQAILVRIPAVLSAVFWLFFGCFLI